MNPTGAHCEKCGSSRVPIIIPPTYFKVLSNIFVQLVRYRAEQVLKTCRAWIFCGYSFPDADMHAKYMLKRVQVNSAFPKVVIVNWHENKEPRLAQEEENRFRRFLGTQAKVEYKKISFEQFAEKPDLIEQLL